MLLVLFILNVNSEYAFISDIALVALYVIFNLSMVGVDSDRSTSYADPSFGKITFESDLEPTSATLWSTLWSWWRYALRENQLQPVIRSSSITTRS